MKYEKILKVLLFIQLVLSVLLIIGWILWLVLKLLGY